MNRIRIAAQLFFLVFADIVQCADVRVTNSSEVPRLALEALALCGAGTVC